MDTDGSKDMSVAELKKALKCLGLNKDMDVEALFAQLDVDSDGRISIEEWDKGLTTEQRHMINNRLTDDGLIRGLDGHNPTKKPNKPATDKVGKAFEHFDIDGSGTLDLDELRILLRAIDADEETLIKVATLKHIQYGAHNAAEVKKTLRDLNVDDGLVKKTFRDMSLGEKEIDMEDFLDTMPPDVKIRLMNKLNDDGTIKGYSIWMDVHFMFKRFDADQSGFISKEELEAAWAVMPGDDGLTADAVFAKCDTNKDGKISKKEWRDGMDDETKKKIAARLEAAASKRK